MSIGVKKLWACGALILLALAAPGVRGDESREQQLPLHILYAGAKDHPRTEAFREFLGRHFATVDTIDLPELSQATAKDADVVIIDSPTPYRGEQNFMLYATPKLGLDFTKPTILMGAAGGSVLGRLRIKLDWL